jgi:hypothetical protein
MYELVLLVFLHISRDKAVHFQFIEQNVLRFGSTTLSTSGWTTRTPRPLLPIFLHQSSTASPCSSLSVYISLSLVLLWSHNATHSYIVCNSFSLHILHHPSIYVLDHEDLYIFVLTIWGGQDSLHAHSHIQRPLKFLYLEVDCEPSR